MFSNDSKRPPTLPVATDGDRLAANDAPPGSEGPAPRKAYDARRPFQTTPDRDRDRRQFLSVVHELEPQVVSSLHTSVGLLFACVPAGEVVTAEYLSLLASRHPAALRTHEALQLWGQRWNLAEPWIYDAALLTLVAHRGTHEPGWALIRGREFEDPFVSLPESLTAWHPLEESEAAFRRRIVEHIRQRRSRALELGLAQAGFSPDPIHFEWLVRYQVRGETHEAISRSASLKSGHPRLNRRDRSTVHQAVTTLARRLGLRLRSAKAAKSGPNSK